MKTTSKSLEKQLSIVGFYILFSITLFSCNLSKSREKKKLEEKAQLFMFEGINEFLKGNYQDAVLLYDKVLELDSNSHTNLALINRASSKKAFDIPGAMEDYTLLIEKKLYNDALYERGQLRVDNGDNLKGILDIDEYLKTNPNKAGAYFYRGLGKGRENDINGAILDYKLAIKMDSTLTIAYLNLAKIYYNNYQFKAALFYLEKILEIVNLGQLAANLNNGDGISSEDNQSLIDIRTALEIKGCILFYSNQREEACEYFKYAYGLGNFHAEKFLKLCNSK